MCGRYSFTASKERVEAQFNVKIDQPLRTSYNIAPTQLGCIITDDKPSQLQYMNWGLVPAWSREGSLTGKLINARKEGISSKPSFRMSMRERRCLVLADSFYEWRREGDNKIPYRIKFEGDRLLAFAGIWDLWQKEGNTVRTFSIITTPPNKEMSLLHSRMPVVFDTLEKQQDWLSKTTTLGTAIDLLQTLSDDQLQTYRISEHLNSPKNNYAELQLEVPEPPTLF